MKSLSIITIFLILIKTIYNEYINCIQENDQLETDEFSFDCSNKNITWSNMPKIIESSLVGVSYNLALNNFHLEDKTIRNFSFNSFKLLSKKLNLSSNSFINIESHAFYYTDLITFNLSQFKLKDTQLKPYLFNELDLSNNSLELIPWNSLKNLESLSILYLNLNPIRNLDFGDLVLKKNEKYTMNLNELYLNKSSIEYIDSEIFSKLLKNLTVLDLSYNKIKHFEYTRFNLKMLLYIDNNPLECNCNLVWLKNYLSLIKQNRNNTCYINTRVLNDNLQIDSKQIFLNTTHYAIQENNVLNNKNHLINHGKEFKKLIKLDYLLEDQFYCDLDLNGKVEDSLSSINIKHQILKLDCSVVAYPQPKIKWLLDQKDLFKIFNYQNKKFRTNNSLTFDNRTHLYKLESSLTILYSDKLTHDNFTCTAFYQTDHYNKFYKSVPYYLQKSVSFYVYSDNINNYEYYSESTIFLNSTHLMVRIPLQSSFYNNNKPFIYYIIIGILILFSFFVILFVSVCIYKNKHGSKKQEQIYAYTGSDYSSINKRSTIYNGSSSIRDGSTVQPLKPDVIREHQDYSSIYGNFIRTPSKHSTYVNTLITTPDSRNSEDNVSIYTNNNTIPIYITNKELQQSFDQNPIDTSLLEDTKSSSDTSSTSKTFEENTEEYLEPKFDDLRKPQQRPRPNFV